MKIFTDAHCLGQNGIDGFFPNAGYTHIRFKETGGERKIHYKKRRLTNNEAELIAIIHACSFASDGDMILTDSKIAQYGAMRGHQKKGAKNLETLKNIAHSLVKEKNLTIEWIPREENPVT